MTEEKKEEIPQEKTAEATGQAVTPTPETKTEAANAQPQAGVPEKKPEDKKVEAPKKEKPSNCAACNKSIKKKHYYYRDGKYYCTKRCWRSAAKKAEKPAEPEGQTKG